ncbi:hypothetical protein M422DRAFT_33204 [Sphaerobolus stellatus SS14]|uniref:Unplaced genomic scaffold SPHSTscaffold_84, whole genome shotgun sequence n=1 Tax=Sphaerobolus stellatus (strain SS14) TaxID=990650 RepID=A0A0C9VAL4_SPHS4|nr:hypothetical protein M422DRAFT_33204 [Sphaerobolus stellatus SS14]
MPPTRTSPRKSSQSTQLTLTGKPVSATSGKGGATKRVYTDVVLTIKPEFVKLLAERTKNHEYRKYKLRETVERVWLYETAPTMALTHVINVGAPRVPGEVKDPSGVGNDDFDAGKKVSKYGYPVQGMYRLPQPLSSVAMKQRYGFGPPQGYMYAPENLVKGEPIDSMEVLY